MSKKRWVVMGLALGLMNFGTVPLSAADTKSAGTPAMDPAMAEAMKLGAPAENHRVLDPLIGKWTVSAKMWMKPGDKPQVSAGTAEDTWILGGRFVREDYKGDFMGQPFEGIGITGYDNVRAEYESLWLDSMMTGIMKSAGAYDTVKKTLMLSGQYSCPMTKEKNKPMRSELKFTGPDARTYSSFDKGPDGKEFKTMEITYKRMK